MEEFRSLLFLLSLGAFPFLTIYFFRKLKFNLLLGLVISFNILGLIYLYFSTYYLITFRLDILDILFIHFFHFSIFCWAAILKLKYSFFKLTHFIILNVIIGISICSLYINFYGPNEANGQYIPTQIIYQDNLKITNSLHTYGFMDSGSRILIRETKNSIFEQIIGVVENGTYFYPLNSKIKIINKREITIRYIYEGEIKCDTLYINRDLKFFAEYL